MFKDIKHGFQLLHSQKIIHLRSAKIGAKIGHIE